MKTLLILLGAAAVGIAVVFWAALVWYVFRGNRGA